MGESAPKVSVILATCCQPVSLRLALAGYRAQSFRDFELIVADDGSGPETRNLLKREEKGFSRPIGHVWQPNHGFRKAKCVNHAVLHSRGTILVFSDGDCIPPPWFLQRYAERTPVDGFALSGYVRLGEEQSRSLDGDRVHRGDHLKMRPLTHRIVEGWRCLADRYYVAVGKMNRPKFGGANFAVSRPVFFGVNGFDEAYDGFGKEDSDLRTRLRRSGARTVSLRAGNTVFHLDPSLDREHQKRLKPRERNVAYYKRPFIPVRAERGLTEDDVDPMGKCPRCGGKDEV